MYMTIIFKHIFPDDLEKLGMDHQGLKVYKMYINDDPGLTLTYFTARSNFGQNCSLCSLCFRPIVR